MHIVNQDGTATKPGDIEERHVFVRGIAARGETAINMLQRK